MSRVGAVKTTRNKIVSRVPVSTTGRQGVRSVAKETPAKPVSKAGSVAGREQKQTPGKGSQASRQNGRTPAPAVLRELSSSPASRPAETPVSNPHHALLLEKRSEILSSLGIKVDNLSKLGRVSEEDQAGQTHEEFVNLRLNKLDYDKLRQVEEAIDRVKAGDYGVCLMCEEPIPPRRLQAIPWAKYCVVCQDRASEMGDDHVELTAGNLW